MFDLYLKNFVRTVKFILGSFGMEVMNQAARIREAQKEEPLVMALPQE
jgi:hypothetical protein